MAARLFVLAGIFVVSGCADWGLQERKTTRWIGDEIARVSTLHDPSIADVGESSTASTNLRAVNGSLLLHIYDETIDLEYYWALERGEVNRSDHAQAPLDLIFLPPTDRPVARFVVPLDGNGSVTFRIRQTDSPFVNVIAEVHDSGFAVPEGCGDWRVLSNRIWVYAGPESYLVLRFANHCAS